MLNLKLNLKYTGIDQKAIMKYKENVEQIHKELHKRANDENDFVGWLELPTNYDKEEFERIKKAAQRIREDSEVLIVIGIGGYITVPVVLAAKDLGIKILLHEQNSIPGKSNIRLSKYADTVCISMESSKKYFEHKNVVLTGNPRGEEILKSKKANKKDYDLSISKKLVLITMGSLGADTINQKIISMLNDFKNKNYEVLLVTGRNNYEKTSNIEFPKNVKVVPYIENMGEVLKVTDLIITRAGATIISEITALGLPSILIPSPYVANNHQYINAKDLENNEAALIIEEKSFDKDELISKIDSILNDSKTYHKMTLATKKMGITDSATRIYKEIKKLCEGD